MNRRKARLSVELLDGRALMTSGFSLTLSAPLSALELNHVSSVSINPQPLPPLTLASINPQPLPPASLVSINPQPLPPASLVSINTRPLSPAKLAIIGDHGFGAGY